MKSNYKPISELVDRVDVRNTDGKIDILIGLSIDKCFIRSVANTIGTDLTKYKVIRKKQFAVSLMQVSRDSKIPVACLQEFDAAIMSPAYSIFQVKDENVILPEYLDMWFKRSEFDREAAFIAVGGVRGSMPWEEFARMKIRVPDIAEQRKIVKAYKTITDRIELKKRINDNLDEQMKALFKSWFIDFEPFKDSLTLTESGNYIPANWIETTLGEYVTYAQGTQVPVEEQYSELNQNRVRFLRIVDYTGNTNDEPRYIDIKAKNSICCPEDILIIRYGASAGQICRGISGVFANNLFRITPIKIISNSYLYYLLAQPSIQSFITSVGETSSAMPALTHGLISSIPVMLPQSPKYLNDFQKIADEVFKQQLLINKEIVVLKSFNQNILANLLSC